MYALLIMQRYASKLPYTITTEDHATAYSLFNALCHSKLVMSIQLTLDDELKAEHHKVEELPKQEVQS